MYIHIYIYIYIYIYTHPAVLPLRLVLLVVLPLLAVVRRVAYAEAQPVLLRLRVVVLRERLPGVVEAPQGQSGEEDLPPGEDQLPWHGHAVARRLHGEPAAAPAVAEPEVDVRVAVRLPGHARPAPAAELVGQWPLRVREELEAGRGEARRGLAEVAPVAFIYI